MSRVHVDGFVLKHDIRSSYVWFLFSSKSRWFCFKTWYSELLRVNFGLGYMSMVCYKTWYSELLHVIFGLGYNMSMVSFWDRHSRSLRATFLVCALADGFVLRRWCRIIWSPLGSSSGSLDFGFWISNEADYKSIFLFWWLIFSGYPIPGCALWLAGSYHLTTSPQMTTWKERAPKATSYNKVGTLVWRQMWPSLLHLASRSVVQCVRLMVRGWLFKLPSAKPAEFPTTIAHTLWWILKSIHTQICRTSLLPLFTVDSRNYLLLQRLSFCS